MKKINEQIWRNNITCLLYIYIYKKKTKFILSEKKVTIIN